MFTLSIHMCHTHRINYIHYLVLYIPLYSNVTKNKTVTIIIINIAVQLSTIYITYTRDTSNRGNYILYRSKFSSNVQFYFLNTISGFRGRTTTKKLPNTDIVGI